MKRILIEIFEELNARMESENRKRSSSGSVKIPPVEIQILGQMALLSDEKLTRAVPLQGTMDLDAKIKNSHYFARTTLEKEILPRYNLIFDSDSEKIWIPPKSNYLPFCKYKFLEATVLDSESVIVSKAVKAPQKNITLVVGAIASGLFPNLVTRIQENGGDLSAFLEDDDG